jgi:D-alanine-D-alanine ligase-like ATP-grasp enzyme
MRLDGLIVRKFRHCQGKDILRAEDAFLVGEIRKIAEVRFDVCRNANGNMKAFRLHLKTPRKLDTFVWNRHNCDWTTVGAKNMVTSLKGDRTPIDIAKRAVAAVGYDFGAVDMVQEENTGAWYVLEVNSAPNIKDAGVKQYAKRLAAT